MTNTVLPKFQDVIAYDHLLTFAIKAEMMPEEMLMRLQKHIEDSLEDWDQAEEKHTRNLLLACIEFVGDELVQRRKEP